MSSRETILAQALELFSKSGYPGTSMRELALACGVTKAALYHHFPNKEAIFLALLESGLHDLEQHLDRLEAHVEAPQNRLQQLIFLLITLPKRSREVMRLSRQDLAHLEHGIQVTFREQYQTRFTSRIAQILQHENRYHPLSSIDITRLFLSMVLPFAQEETQHAQEQAQILADFFQNGFSKGSALPASTETP